MHRGLIALRDAVRESRTGEGEGHQGKEDRAAERRRSGPEWIHDMTFLGAGRASSPPAHAWGNGARQARAAFTRRLPQPGSGGGRFEQRRENGRWQLRLVVRPVSGRSVKPRRRDRRRIREPVDEQMNMGAGPVRFMIGIGRIAMAMAMPGMMMVGRERVIVADRRDRAAVGESQSQHEQQGK